MPEQTNANSLLELLEDVVNTVGRSNASEYSALLTRLTALKTSNDWQRGKKTTATNVERYNLGCNVSGQPQYMIAMDVEGKREHHTIVKLATGDPQSFDVSNIDNSTNTYSDEDAFLDQLSTVQGPQQISMICDAETLRLNTIQRERLSRMLWDYIIAFRDSVSSDALVAVGSAIRKYVSMLNVQRIGEIAPLLEAGHRIPLPLDLELEVVKMVYRKFEANPPGQQDPQPDLAARLWEMAQDYMRPRLILRDKNATVASLSIEALVAMRSHFAREAVAAAFQSPFIWFGEMVADNLHRLSNRWQTKNAEAANWCEALLVEPTAWQEGNVSASNASR